MLIIGAKGFAKEIFEILTQLAYKEEVYFWDNVSKDLPEKLFGKYPILRTEIEAQHYFDSQQKSFIIGVGGGEIRKTLGEKFIALGGTPFSCVSPFARIGSQGVSIGQGCCITTGTVLTADVSIGNWTLLNLNVTVGHDSKVGIACELSPGVHISGRCTVGNYCRIGTGAVLLPDVTLGDNVTVGAGAVVTKDVPTGLTVVGVPAKPLHKS